MIHQCYRKKNQLKAQFKLTFKVEQSNTFSDIENHIKVKFYFGCTKIFRSISLFVACLLLDLGLPLMTFVLLY